jgi:hypothetical protein
LFSWALFLGIWERKTSRPKEICTKKNIFGNY